MAKDIFEKFKENMGPIGQHARDVHGYFTFPKLEGEIGNKMKFRGKEILTWSVSNYLGLANHPEVREIDSQSAEEYGLAYPMGSRVMTGHTNEHEALEDELADFMEREDAFLLNFGYQGMVSIIEALVDRNDVIVYDSEAHACIQDGMRLHAGKRFVFQHNNLDSFGKQMERATKLVNETNGGILVITEGVFDMSGVQGKLKEIVEFRKSGKYDFRLLVDDSHGFGILGETGKGTGEQQGVHDEIDVLFSSFGTAMATTGGFVVATEQVVNYLRYNMRSQIFGKSLSMPVVIGARKRLEIIKNQPKRREKLWEISTALQKGLKKIGLNIGNTNSPITPILLEGDISEATNLTLDLRENHNVFCSVVIEPVVPSNTILMKLIPTTEHTLEDVKYTIETFVKVQEKLEKGDYKAEELVNSVDKEQI